MSEKNGPVPFQKPNYIQHLAKKWQKMTRRPHNSKKSWQNTKNIKNLLLFGKFKKLLKISIPIVFFNFRFLISHELVKGFF